MVIDTSHWIGGVMDYITVGDKELKKLKRLYNKALKNNVETFFFQGKEILVGYAKYLIQYLEGRMK